MAEDYTAKRRDMASKAIDAATQIVEGVWTLQNMAHDLAQSGGGFDDADFVGTANGHVNAWKMNTLVNDVAAALSGAADGKLAPDSQISYKDILLAVKRA